MRIERPEKIEAAMQLRIEEENFLIYFATEDEAHRFRRALQRIARRGRTLRFSPS